jgi:hypothetical protein
VNEKSLSTTISTDHVSQFIYIIRGRRVVLGHDLAQLYEVETKALNRAVQRNKERFPEDFMFRLNLKEFNFLRCQFGTSNELRAYESQSLSSKEGRGGRRYLPYAFTEQGVAMLSSVLRSPQAVAEDWF